MVGGFGVTAGAHRYWTHRSYKANVPFRVILMLCYCSAGQVTLVYVHTSKTTDPPFDH